MPTHRATEPLILSIGHYLGPLYVPDSEPARVHQVRRGPNIDELPETDFIVWALAQGLADKLDDTTWTRAVVEETAQQAGIEHPAEVVDRLLADEYLVEVDPADAREFALRYQLRPLMLGLGNSPEEPWLYGIGFGDQPVLKVSRAVYSLWEWAHLDGNLWDACETFSEVEQEAGGKDKELTDPQRVLSGLVAGLHHLTSTAAAYLDIAQSRLASL
jgi:hypothetical protein